MRIDVLGPQGSGKTTQAEFISKHFNIPLIDVGQLIRDFCSIETPENSYACELLRNGQLVPNALAGSVLKDAINKHSNSGFVLDGYPRSIDQLDTFDPKVDKVFFVSVSDDVAIERLLKRKRMDDTPEGIKTRLQIYHEKTSAVLDYYRNMGILIEIDGNRSKEEIFEDILRSLDAVNKD